jgi:hypothetical protein
MLRTPRALVQGMDETARSFHVHGWRLVPAKPANADQLLVPWWLPSLFVLFGLVLAPWIVGLIATLPSRQVANHWEIAWAGFDAALAIILVSTGVALARRSSAAGILAAMAGTFLICDAWFDTMTARGRTNVTFAILEAVLVELPLAIVCLWIAHNVGRVLADARPFLERAGFRLEHHRLVPPAAPD